MADDKLLAVLIDADNIPGRHAEGIFGEIAGFGEAAVRRAYGDWSRSELKQWAGRMAEFGLTQVQVPQTSTGKNASDIALAIDAVDLLHSGRFTGFVIVSSDGDFTRLAARLREGGVEVTGIGRRNTPEAFRKACKRFIYVENLSTGAEPEADAGTAVGASSPSPASAEKARGAAPLAEARDLILQAMDAMESDDEWIGLGALGQYLQRANPDFDTRTWGKKKLSDLVREIKRFEMRIGPGSQPQLRRLD